jgi:hypothetical protein
MTAPALKLNGVEAEKTAQIAGRAGAPLTGQLLGEY